MKRIMLKIAYNGSAFSGWETGGAPNSIEELLNNTISNITNENIKVIGASRTDSGVHANANFAVFDTNSDIKPDKFFYILNNALPQDISILNSCEVPQTFNPRKTDTRKTYIYRIHNSKIRNPLKEFNTHFVHYDIDVQKMIEASKYLIGTHNFKSFINPESQVLQNYKDKNYENFNKDLLTTRTIYDISITKDDDIISIKIIGNGFLYHMVRIMAGTLLKIGMNMWEPQYIQEILDKKDRKYAGFTLPARGLTLENIEFL